MATTFPTLTGSAKSPRPIGYSKTIASDPTIRSPKEAGYVQTRARYTRHPKTHHFLFEGITEYDKDLIEEHQDERGVGGASFTWTPPRGTSGNYRFASPIICTPFEETNYKFWNVEMELEEV